MTDDNKFLSVWKPIHQKGIITYVGKYALIFLVTYTLAFVIVIAINGSIKTEKTNEIISCSICTLLFYTLILIFNWFRSEKKYNEIVNNRN